MLIRATCVALTTLGVCTDAAAQEYFDFGQVAGVPEHPAVQVDLDGDLLDFIAAIAERQEPAVAEIIGGLSGARVLVYDTFEDQAAVSELVDETSRALERAGWQRTVNVQEEGDEKVRLYTQVDGQRMSGMTVLVLDASEAIFVNIAGPIEAAQIGRVADAMGFGGVLSALGPGHTGHGARSNERGE